MVRWHTSRLAAVASVLVLGGLAQAAERENTAIKPAMKNPERHQQFMNIARKGNVDVLFLGDSITDGWRGQKLFKERFEPLKTANFGIGGDRTQHVLWRLQNGELDKIKPKVVMLMIGTNNLGANTDEEIAEGIRAIVKEIRQKSPDSKILLLGIFPRGQEATDRNRPRIKKINEMISKLDKQKNVRYLDIGDKFLEKDGSLSRDIMPDYLHLSAKGYKIWADAVEPVIKKMMNQ